MDCTTPENTRLLKQFEKEAAAMSMEELEAELFETPEKMQKLAEDIKAGKIGPFIMDGRMSEFVERANAKAKNNK